MNVPRKECIRAVVPALVAAILLAMQTFPARLGAQTLSPAAADPATLPAHDSHQGLLIAADPYVTSERSEQKFGKRHPYSVGLLAIDLFLRNDSETPLRINLDTIELHVAAPGQKRQRLESLTPQEVAYRIVVPNGPALRAKRGPIPGIAGGKQKEIAKMADSLRYLMLESDLVGPHNTIQGFVIFDVDRHFEDTEHSTLYIPDVSRVGSGNKLFFFEIDLKSATH
jgi:hypothetical protein